jgi:hypothetical protein
VLPVSVADHAVDSPYRMRFASYIRSGETTSGQFDEMPEQFRIRYAARVERHRARARSLSAD